MKGHLLVVASICMTAAGVPDSLPAHAATATVQLPQPRLAGTISLEEAILKRRSIRRFADAPLAIAEVGQLLWAAQGVTSPKGLRAAPSAGALYPLELYLVAGRVTGLPAGIYHYHPESHSLTPVDISDRRGQLSVAGHQSAIKDAPASLVFAAVFERTKKKYGERGIRYVQMDAGHAAQNVYLQAVALDLGTFVIGGFDDEAVAKTLSLPSAGEPLAIMPVGRVVK
jgi:SagB-type dehydrogenase family enzyme